MKALSIVGKILAALAALGLIVLVVALIGAYSTPLNPPLDTPAPGSAQSAPAAKPPSDGGGVQAVCGENQAWNLLVLGSDSSDLRYRKGSDLTRMVRVDFPNRKVTMVAFTRDLWVDTTTLGLANPTVNAAGLGEVFYEARLRSTEIKEIEKMIDATNVSAKMMAQNFGLVSDHYVAIDLSRVAAMVDTVGGIPFNNPAEITDPWIEMVIPAGQQTLTGVQVVAFARAKPDSDFARIDRNHLLLEAMRQKALDPAVLVKLPNLFGQFKEAIATDLTPGQIAHLSCLLKDLPQSAIVQDEVKQEWTTPNAQGYLLWDKQKVADLLKVYGMIE